MPQQNLAATRVVLKPHRHLFARGLLAVFALTTPVFAVVYWLTVPSHAWPIALLVHVLVLLACLLSLIAFFDTVVTVGDRTVTERGFFGRVHTFTADQVGYALLVDVYQSNALETTPQLFLCDIEGRRLLRLRGQFWSRESMRKVLDDLEVPVTEPSEAVTLAELHRRSPNLLYWFERMPRLRRS